MKTCCCLRWGCLLVMVWLSAPALALFVRPDIEQVPTERLIRNLEAKTQKSPNDQALVCALARVHAIAFAQGQETMTVLRETQLPWYGPTDHGWPAEKPGAGLDREAGAQGHLDRAIQLYRQAVRMDEKHLPSQLGLGWCLDQAGHRDEARDVYRAAFKLAWDKEGQNEGLYMGLGITEEIALYLVPLLDEEKDREEIARIQDRAKTVKAKPRFITPVLVPLEDGVSWGELVRPTAEVTFDLDGSGLPRRWGWLSSRAAWLVHDPVGRGEVTSGLQLFGSVTFWVFWRHGYEALASLDNDGDGWLREDELHGLALWQDADGDGHSGPGEVRPVLATDIVALACQGEEARPGLGWWHPRGLRLKDGRERPTFDWVQSSGP